MNVTKCDRCGKVVKGKELVVVDVSNLAARAFSIFHKIYDLCPECERELYAWMEYRESMCGRNDKES